MAINNYNHLKKKMVDHKKLYNKKRTFLRGYQILEILDVCGMFFFFVNGKRVNFQFFEQD